MQKTLRFEAENGYDEVVLIDKIIRLSKSDKGKYTFIHLTNGEKIQTEDSIRTLDARLNSEE
jgi:hypothetical protein